MRRGFWQVLYEVELPNGQTHQITWRQRQRVRKLRPVNAPAPPPPPPSDPAPVIVSVVWDRGSCDNIDVPRRLSAAQAKAAFIKRVAELTNISVDSLVLSVRCCRCLDDDHIDTKLTQCLVGGLDTKLTHCLIKLFHRLCNR